MDVKTIKKYKTNIYSVSFLFIVVILGANYFTEHENGLNPLLLFFTLLVSATAIIVSDMISDISESVWKTIWYNLMLEIPIVMGVYFTSKSHFDMEDKSSMFIYLIFYLLLKYAFLSAVESARLKRN